MVIGVPDASWYLVSTRISASRAAAECRALPRANSGQLCNKL